MCYFKSGKGRYKTYSREYTIKPGDIFIFRSNEIHWISEIAADEPMEIMNMQNTKQSVMRSGNLNPMWGKRHDVETKKKISLSKQGTKMAEETKNKIKAKSDDSSQ